VLVRKLECVLQHITQCREEQIAIGIEGKLWIDARDRKFAVACQSFERGRHLNFTDEVGKREELVSRRHSGCDPHVRQRLVQQCSDSHQTVAQDRACRSA